MERIKITADVRETGKKGANRRLRKGGEIPAILYGRGETPMAISINTKTLTHLLKGAAGTNALIDLDLKGKSGGEPIVAILKDYQRDAILHTITHVDLLKINMKEKITVKVPVHVTGKAIGQTKGGLVELVRRELEVRCLPDSIPGKIDVDITSVDIGHSLHVKDLTWPAGVEPAQAGDLTVVSIVAPREEVVEVAPVAAAVEGAAAGAAAESAGGGAAPAAGEAKKSAGGGEGKTESAGGGKPEKK